ncbi:MAG: hypothetical protein GTN74_14150 [Proteobacteria bacterium]|nr:hypothetical protein [Pseudomonadota bacterium]NIS71672.1 hypothetical protein [Pseudomonadota bacterium]
MAVDISAKVALTRDEIVHVYHGGVLSVKIKGKKAQTSVEISCIDSPPIRGTRIRFKHVDAD